MEHFIIDIGSNTVKYSVFEKTETGYIRRHHRSETLQFIRYISEGEVSEEGVARLLTVLDSFLHDAGSFGVFPENLHCFATASFRRLRDPRKLCLRILQETGLTVELIPGEEEARLTFLGMLGNCGKAKNGVMLDLGGGSLELTLFRERERCFSHSNGYGSLSLAERFVRGDFPTRREEKFLRDSVREQTVLPVDREPCGYAVGGSAKAIAALLAERRGERFLPGEDMIPVTELQAFFAEAMDGKWRAEMKRLFPDRYRVLLPAVIIYDEIFTQMGITSFCVPEGGMRDGYYLDRIYGREKA